MPKKAEYRFLFLWEGQVSLGLVGTVEDNWTEIYDMIFDSDAVAIQRKDARSISREEALMVMALLIEDMSEDGQPLIWRIENGSLFVSVDWESAAFGIRSFKQYREFLTREKLDELFDESIVKRMEKTPGKGRFREPAAWKKFGFHGAIKALASLEIRPPIEELIQEAKQTDPGELTQFGAQRRAMLLMLEEVMSVHPFARNRRLWEYANQLYEQFVESGAKEFHSVLESADPILEVRQWLERLGVGTVGQIVEAIKQTPEVDEWLIEWDKEVMIELYDHPRLQKSPYLFLSILELLEEAEIVAETCVWCGKKNPEDYHLDECAERRRLLRL